MDTLHEDIYAVMIILRSVLLDVRNHLDEVLATKNSFL
jgi:hypothetical protein